MNKRPITTSGGNNGRSSLTRTPTIINNNSSGSILNNNTSSGGGAHFATGNNNVVTSTSNIYYANNTNNNNNQSNRSTMNGNGTTFTRPTFGNPVPMINATTTNHHTNNNSNNNSVISGNSTFIPPVFHRPSPAPSNTTSSSSVNRPVAASSTVEARQQFIPPKIQTFQKPNQFSTPSNTQKRNNNFPHSGLSTPKSGKKQPLHLVSCLSPPSSQFSTPNRSTQTPSTPVQTSKPSPSSSTSNTSSIFPFNSNNNNNSFISNNNTSINKPLPQTSHARFVIPNNFKPQEVSRVQSTTSNLSDSQKENEEIEKLKAEIEALKGNLNKKKLENEELEKSKKEIEEQLLTIQTKMEENQQENSGLLDDVNDDFLLAVLDEIDEDKMKDEKSNEETSQNSQKKDTEQAPTEEKTGKADEKSIPLVPETATKKISKKRVKWKNKNIADLQKDPGLHKALYKLLVYKGNSENPIDAMDTDTIDEQSNEPLSAKLWKAHRTISNDQSKMYTLLPILNSYLKQANVEFDTELFMCTLETILKLVLESEMFRVAFIESFSHENSFIGLKTKKIIQEHGYSPHPLFSSTTIIIPDSKKSVIKGKLREKRKYLQNYLNDVAYQPDFIFDSNMDSILFNPEEVPIVRNEGAKTELLSDLLAYFAAIPEYLNSRHVDILCTILEIVKTLAVWSPESALDKFISLIENGPINIKTVFSNTNVELIQKSLEVLTVLVKSETIRSSMQNNNILTRVAAILNVDIGNTDETLQCRRMILRLFHYLAFLCPEGISLLKEKHFENNIVFDAMIFLLGKELEIIALLEDFSNESERIYLIRDIVILFNHVYRLNSTIPYISPSLRLDYNYAKTAISIIREKAKFKEKFQLDEMK